MVKVTRNKKMYEKNYVLQKTPLRMYKIIFNVYFALEYFSQCTLMFIFFYFWQKREIYDVAVPI